jgi:2-polyprenyl-6-hydroxyphenyl methylase/3-demethylubiquinone-9 3-methyltransferase
MQRGTEQVTKRFAFGANWASYAARIGEQEISKAIVGLSRLAPDSMLRGRSFLDIGCGSGLHSVAAARLGVESILAIDVDPDSVATARSILQRHHPVVPFDVMQLDALELDAAKVGRFGVVYAWGVLHHTGDMWRALERAAAVVEPGGFLIFALYRRTRLDAIWTIEKRWYAQSSPRAQALARRVYVSARRLAWAMRGVSYQTYIENYSMSRGMDFDHDVHDWLGGYPYQTALPLEVDRRMRDLSFAPEQLFPAIPRLGGLLGSACDEYVYRQVGGPLYAPATPAALPIILPTRAAATANATARTGG